MKQKIYLAGGMSGDWQNQVIAECPGFQFFNPCDHGKTTPSEYTAWDLHFVRQCDIVFAYISAGNKSGYGAAIEIGFAAALGKTIIICDERSHVEDWFKSKYAIAHCAATVSFSELGKAIEFLQSFSLCP